MAHPQTRLRMGLMLAGVSAHLHSCDERSHRQHGQAGAGQAVFDLLYEFLREALMNTNDSVYFTTFSTGAAQTCPKRDGRHQTPRESQRSHQSVAGNKPHHAGAPRTGMSLKRFPRRTPSGAAGPCCC